MKARTAFDCLRPEHRKALERMGIKAPAGMTHNTGFMTVQKSKQKPKQTKSNPELNEPLLMAEMDFSGQGEVAQDDKVLAAPAITMEFDNPAKQKPKPKPGRSVDDVPLIAPAMIFSRSGQDEEEN